MSQRTRTRTTGDATGRRNKTATTARQPETAQTPELVSTDQSDAAAAGVPPGGDAGRAAPDGEQTAAAKSTFAPETLARTLRAVAAELERDPDLARRVARAVAEPGEQPSDVPAEPPKMHTTDTLADAPEQAMEAPSPAKRAGRAFRPRLVTGMSPDLGQGVVDPFALYATRGEDGLRGALDELRLGSLRAIMREHRIDPSGKLTQQNDAEKLRAAILKAARKRRG